MQTRRTERVKAEVLDEDDGELIDVSGDDPSSQVPVAHIIRTNRLKRSAPAVNLRPRRRMDPSMEEEFEELNAEDNQTDLNYEPTDELEMEIESDVALIRREQGQRVSKGPEFADHGPVEFRFDSTQRKKQVIIYNSARYPGRASEWYFARKNDNTNNETYRCVQCRRSREEAKRQKRQGVPDRPEARIIVQMDRFCTDPDDPLGQHICNFEQNDRTLLDNVWLRRALNKANSELRLVPAKPKVKFDELVQEIQEGDEYAHLPKEVREKMVSDLTMPDGNAKKGFASRRRSFARNNRIARLSNATKKEAGDTELYNTRSSYSKSVMHYICGVPNCNKRFLSRDERQVHWSSSHPDIYFIDSPEGLKAFNSYRHSGNMINAEELVVADEQEISEEMRGDAIEGVEYDDYLVREQMDPDQEDALNQFICLQERLRAEMEIALSRPKQRAAVLQHMQEAVEKIENSREELMPEIKVYHEEEEPEDVTLASREEVDVEL